MLAGTPTTIKNAPPRLVPHSQPATPPKNKENTLYRVEIFKLKNRTKSRYWLQILNSIGCVAEHSLPSILRTLFMWYERQTRYAFEDSPLLDTRQRHRSKGSAAPSYICWFEERERERKNACMCAHCSHTCTHANTCTHSHAYICTIYLSLSPPPPSFSLTHSLSLPMRLGRWPEIIKELSLTLSLCVCLSLAHHTKPQHK